MSPLPLKKETASPGSWLAMGSGGNPGSQGCVTSSESLDLSGLVSSPGKRGEEQSLFLGMNQQDAYKN